MAIFRIKAEDPVYGNSVDMLYNNETSSFTYSDGVSIVPLNEFPRDKKFSKVFSKTEPLTKSSKPILVKIQLGLSCNYDCGYCSQKYVPRADETSLKNIPTFIEKLTKNLTVGPDDDIRFEFWGGEPFVYWKTIEPLAKVLRLYYPNCKFKITTNGSLLTRDKVDWILDNKVIITLSHDGPQQKYRNQDPFNDPVIKQNIYDLYHEAKKRDNQIFFNSVIHNKNYSRKEIRDFFIDFTGDRNVKFCEGGVLDTFDEGSYELSFVSLSDKFSFRRTSLQELMTENLNNFTRLQAIDSFISSIVNSRDIKECPQKCGMEREDKMAVDLLGNVLTCQDVTIDSIGPNGESHLAGSLDSLSEVKITTSTHWSLRKNCSSCPVIHICQGSCMFLDGDLFEASCENSYNEHIVYFAYAIYKLTGYVPVWVEGKDLPSERMDIWGNLTAHIEKPIKKIIKIKEI